MKPADTAPVLFASSMFRYALCTLLVAALPALSQPPSAADTLSPRSPIRVADFRPASADSLQQPRRRSIQVSEWYARRLTIHRIGSYAMLPLFGAQYLAG